MIADIVWGFLVFTGVVFVGLLVLTYAKDWVVNNSAKSLLSRALKKFPEFGGQPVIKGAELILVVDEARQTTLVATSDGAAKEIPFSSYERIKILEDGHTVSETRRTGTLARAAVGGLVAGGAGAIVGGLSAGSVTNNREIVTNITVAVLTSDKSFPMLAWRTYSPTFAVDQLTPADAQLARLNAQNFAQQFTPIFTANESKDVELAAI
ncbi:MAG: hypothetical protein AAF557_15370 [Pseudomonadota bacterium]